MDSQRSMDLFFGGNEAEKAERTKLLLHELNNLVKGGAFSWELWACLHLADLGSLRSIVEDVKPSRVPQGVLGGYEQLVKESKLVRHSPLRKECYDSRATSTATTPVQPSTPAQADTSASHATQLPGHRKRRWDGVQRRDQLQSELESVLLPHMGKYSCMLTENTSAVYETRDNVSSQNLVNPLKSPIFSLLLCEIYRLRKARAQSFGLWKALKLFWTEEKVNSVQFKIPLRPQRTFSASLQMLIPTRAGLTVLLNISEAMRRIQAVLLCLYGYLT
ncbi:hypothetical protein AJ78_08296 [Emergomyces pasteurianus Ep9510]|uniref:Uncharacterized protein n=1 Tax=Emergomyces pasteurianus Ep9510 TaxID=1447872 RepID=A0A1J9Q4D2_9EURO|nr:hypothetical protein AJ78_08296 [Emergomyces pasteurianus Ep9510]